MPTELGSGATREILWNGRLVDQGHIGEASNVDSGYRRGRGAGRRCFGPVTGADDATIRTRVLNEIDNGKAVVIVGTGTDGKSPQLAWSKDTPTDQTIIGPGIGIPLPVAK